MMFVERETVGHAGEIVGRDAGGLRIAYPTGEIAPFARQTLRLSEISGEKIMDDTSRPRAQRQAQDEAEV